LTTARGKLGLVLLGAAGVGAAMASVFDINHPLHIVAALMGIVGFPIGAVLISGRLRRDPKWAHARRPLLWTANLTWLSIVLFGLALMIMTATYLATGAKMTDQVPTTLPAGVIALPGWANRLTIVANSLWVATVAWQALQVVRDETREMASPPRGA
jgi:preprotein translocase subunit SecF